MGGLEKYAGNVIRQRSSSPKFQVYNNALLTSQSDETFEDTVVNPKLWGRLVESSVGAHLINHSISDRYNLYYWHEGNFEVDFVLEKGGKVVGLEVKSGAHADNEGMGVFAEKFQPDKVLLVGTRRNSLRRVFEDKSQRVVLKLGIINLINRLIRHEY